MPETRPFVIAVGGIPGSGKTTLARRLADALHVPLVVRDEIKEGMHVTVRSVEPAEVRRFASEAFAVFWTTVELLLDAGVSLVAEAAYHRDFAAVHLERLAERVDVRLLWCVVDPEVALARYRARAPLRHPAHADALMAERMAHPAFDRSTYDPPAGPWSVTEVDTTGPEPVPTIEELRATLGDTVGPIRVPRPS